MATAADYSSLVLLGGYDPIKSNKDRSVVAAAKFAVSEHNNKLHDDATNKTSLEFVRIVDGLEQTVEGINYKLVILVTDGSSYNYYGVYLYDGCWQNYKTLYFFNRIAGFGPEAPSLATFVGAYVPIDNPKDPTVVAAAKFAVAEWAKTTTSLEFERVVEGEARVDDEINYKLVILTKDNINGSAKYDYYEAVIDVHRDFFHHDAGIGELTTLQSFKRIRSEDTSGATTPSSF